MSSRGFLLLFTEVTDRVSETYSSALLAMSLSYYYIMGEHLRKDNDERMDEILSSLLTMYGNKAYSNPCRSSASELHTVCMCMYVCMCVYVRVCVCACSV